MKASQGKSSVWADEGTAAHSLIEQCVRKGMVPVEFFGQQIEVNGETYLVNSDMVKATSHYVQHVRRTIHGNPDGQWYLEHRGNSGVYDITGTVDFMMESHRDKYVAVEDYKHGKGVYVSEVMNAQMLFYALVALDRWPRPSHADVPNDITVDMTIHQPRFPGVKPARTYRATSGEILDWVNKTVHPAVRDSRHTNARIQGGDHCRFCPAKPICTVYLTVQKPRFQHVPVQPDPVPEGFSFF